MAIHALAKLTWLSIVCVQAVSAGFWTNSNEDESILEAKSIESGRKDEPVEYGVDISFPMHYATISNNYAWLKHNTDPNTPTPEEYKDMPIQPLGDRAKFYQDFLSSCEKHFGKKGARCVQNEKDRIAMSLRQPQSMQNYTSVGFKSEYR